MISSCVRIDVRISAAANRVVEKHAVLFDPFIGNTENLSHNSPVVSSKILRPQRFRRIDQRVDDTEMRLAFILVHPYPPSRSGLPLNVFFGRFGQNLYVVGDSIYLMARMMVCRVVCTTCQAIQRGYGFDRNPLFSFGRRSLVTTPTPPSGHGVLSFLIHIHLPGCVSNKRTPSTPIPVDMLTAEA